MKYFEISFTMKNNQLITLVLVISIIFSCSKDEPIVEPPKETPKVTTKVYENLTHNSVILVGEVISEGSSSIIEQGFYYTEGTSAEKKIIISIGSKNFKVDLKFYLIQDIVIGLMLKTL